MDGVVSGLVINKLDTLIQMEVNLVCGANKEFKTLRDELRLLQPYITGIYNQNSDSDELVRELVKQLHEVSCNAEDAIDLYLYDNVTEYKRLKYWAKRLLCAAVPNLCRRRQLKGIKETIKCILDLKQKYELLNGNTSTSTHNQLANNVMMSLNVQRILVAEGDDVVGFEEALSDLLNKLMPIQNDAMERRTISIIGMGGTGKTTLAKKIYNNKDVTKYFTTKVWVVGSQEKNIYQLLACILRSFDKNILLDGHDTNDLKEELKNKLENGRYLIAMDDIWDPELCKNLLQSCLPADPKNESRIMLTSRRKEVANGASKDDSDTYEIDPLKENDSWLLFCNVALKGNACPNNLVTTGKKLVSKCKGLPLAIIVLGGVLSTAEMTPSFECWLKFLEDRSWQQDCGCLGILSLSYQCLPVHLKICFLYIGIFPEDYEILAHDICLLWIAEGFITCQEDQEMDVAEQYLVELANKHLITVNYLGFDGCIVSFRIHDMLRDFCIKEAGKCYLYEVDGKGTFAGVTKLTRRLNITSYKSMFNIPIPSLQRLRTLLVLGVRGVTRLEYINICDDNLPLVRVLHTERNSVTSTARQYRMTIKKMVLLKYLSVSVSSICIDLTSLCKMLNLQFLNLNCRGPGVFKFPNGFWNLKHLKHLEVFLRATIPDARSADDRMLYLQTLSSIETEEHTLKLIRECRFPKLRNISLIKFDSHQPVEVLSLPLLKSLSIVFESVKPLVGAFSSTLTNITLTSQWEIGSLTSDEWMFLGKLENLQVLKLYNFKLPTPSLEFNA